MEGTLLDEGAYFGGILQIWSVTLTGQTEVVLPTNLGSVVGAFAQKNPTRATVPFYETYVNLPTTRGGTVYVWASDINATDDIIVFVFGKR